ncbi:MAG TPA: biotin carboxylase N-terminal domain-containing protein, partial [Alphaproteobacteria bacterium]|nr:biotin carboxylase N-terminal domain-containing protein [Alphaproteobacteria bacterium]
METLRRVLIANRGEIAIRIAKAAHGVGMEAVAVNAPADAHSLHTRVASQARTLPQTVDPVAAYLDGAALIEIAKETGCDCVHPGYGFLSENANFAAMCAAAGLTFVGPSPSALRLFGDKVTARALAASHGIPTVAGSSAALASAAEAEQVAASLGYPVMLKAAAGGGGRGMRAVASPDELADAFARCQSEAAAAFGDGSVFVEKLIDRPRHIEVQILADGHGHTVHLWERDCSVQIRNQKVIEIAPAANLQERLRQRILEDAVKLAKVAEYANAGTVEFLVSPEEDAHYFIECNPRIQVEHTVTEQVMGIDLVQAQFRIAAGAKLQELGLPDQAAVGSPRGHAVQARVVAQGTGTLSAYKEPSGPGVRVDACGYLGLTPPPHFDPLLAKVIGFVGTGGTLAAAVERTRAALAEFHIAGLPTNLAQLDAILSEPLVVAGDARTTLMAEHSELAGIAPVGAGGETLAFLAQQAQAVVAPAARGAARVMEARLPELDVPPAATAVDCPMAGTVVQFAVAEGQRVTSGETLLVISAMKMEAAVPAPCSGTVTALQPIREGDAVTAGQLVAAITPAEGDAERDLAALDPSETWGPQLEEVRALQDLADQRLAPGSEEIGVVRQRTRGKLTCRERIDLLLDQGSFREVGSLAGFASYDEDGHIAAFTPANHVGGTGQIARRQVVVCADDFTSRGGHADGAISNKSRYLDRLSLELNIPSIRLLDGSSGGGSVATMVPTQVKSGKSAAEESSGAIKAGQPRVTGGGGSFLPGHLGSEVYRDQLGTVPVVNMLLGSVVGIGAAKA